MTRKKAIKTIMSVTGHGDKRAANKAFDNVKNALPGILEMPMYVIARSALSTMPPIPTRTAQTSMPIKP